MAEQLKIKGIAPHFVIEGGEIEIECAGFDADWGAGGKCFIDSVECRISAASSKRLLVIVPENVEGKVDVVLESSGLRSEAFEVTAGTLTAADMHFVANPAVDPADDSIILTISGSRGQQVPVSLFRAATDGRIDDIDVGIMNPTGLAFDSQGGLYVSNRASGEIYRVENSLMATVVASGLGIATGIAFDNEDRLYVGDRSGTIYRLTTDLADREIFAELEPSVSAYHIAFGPDKRLYVTAPGLASNDVIYAISDDGSIEVYAKGFGRPQGMAFDTDGNLYAAACFESRHGIVRIDAATRKVEMFVAVNNAVGLCFNSKGEMIIATNDSVYTMAAAAD